MRTPQRESGGREEAGGGGSAPSAVLLELMGGVPTRCCQKEDGRAAVGFLLYGLHAEHTRGKRMNAELREGKGEQRRAQPVRAQSLDKKSLLEARQVAGTCWQLLSPCLRKPSRPVTLVLLEIFLKSRVGLSEELKPRV
jgi:hypothetical protein